MLGGTRGGSYDLHDARRRSDVLRRAREGSGNLFIARGESDVLRVGRGGSCVHREAWVRSSILSGAKRHRGILSGVGRRSDVQG